MAIDIGAVRAQQRELNMVSDEISSVKHRLKFHQESLDNAWKGTEIKGIDSAIEDIIRRLNRISGNLEDLGHDIMATGEEIKAEEEEAERRAREEAEKEAGEAAEKETLRQASENKGKKIGGEIWRQLI